jgi:iron complex transport system substrate-binding protein
MANLDRIVCLTEETCEWLYLLGEEKRIVGISAYTVRPPEAAREKPKVSAFISGNVAKIHKLKPDLIVGFSDIQAELAQKLVKVGLNVLITNQRTLAEIFDTLLLVATLVGKRAQGQKYLAAWKKKLEKISRKTNGRKKPRIFFQEWDEPVITAIAWVSELIEICGGKNICAEKSHAMAKDRIVDLKTVAKRRPDAIIGSWCGKPVDFDWIKNSAELKQTPAVKSGRLYEIASAEILQPGPAVFLDGVERLYEAIWQEKL